MAITPWQFACPGKAPVLRAFPLSMSIALRKNSRQRFLCGETSTTPEQRHFLSISFFLVFFCLLQLRSRRQGITTRGGDGAPGRPTLRWRVGVNLGLLE